MVLVRLCKTALVAWVALFFTIVAYGNITDYGSNWQFVQHVLSMDTIFPTSTLKWRSITSPDLQTVAYWGIIGWQIATAIVLWLGCALLLAASPSGRNFAGARPVAVAGLTMGLLLYGVGFVVIGGEWFAMWQSTTWNGEQKAFGFIGVIGLVLVVLLSFEAETT